MKSQAEIQRAHDLLVGIILGECPALVLRDKESKLVCGMAAAAMCWVLEHDHNPAFQNLIDDIQRKAAKHGYHFEVGEEPPPARGFAT